MGLGLFFLFVAFIWMITLCVLTPLAAWRLWHNPCRLSRHPGWKRALCLLLLLCAGLFFALALFWLSGCWAIVDYYFL